MTATHSSLPPEVVQQHLADKYGSQVEDEP